MYNEHHAQTLSHEIAVQNVKEFASNAAISSDGSFQNRWPTYFWHEWPHETREGRVGERMVGVFLSCL